MSPQTLPIQKRGSIALFASFAAIILAGYAVKAQLAPPRTAPDYDRVAPPPSPSDAEYVSHTEVREAKVEVRRYLAWSDVAPLDDILNGDPKVPAVVGTDLVRGAWNQPAARRRVRLADGHYAAEEVLAKTDLADGGRLFRYEVFGYTNYAKLALDHAVGEFLITPTPAGHTRIEWTYRYHCRAGVTQPFVRSFVSETWAPYMVTVLDGMVRRAERDS